MRKKCKQKGREYEKSLISASSLKMTKMDWGKKPQTYRKKY